MDSTTRSIEDPARGGKFNRRRWSNCLLLWMAVVLGCSPRSFFESDTDNTPPPADPDQGWVQNERGEFDDRNEFDKRDEFDDSRQFAVATSPSGTNSISDQNATPERWNRQRQIDRLFADDLPKVDLNKDDLPKVDPPTSDGELPPPASSQTSPRAFGSRTPQSLIDKIDGADQLTRQIVTGPGSAATTSTTPEENRQSLINALLTKRDAAIALASHPDADDDQRLMARRSKLAAVSGLAALGDADAAELLAYIADIESDADSPALALDATSVQIALAVQSMVAGDDAAVDRIAERVRQTDNLIGQIKRTSGQPVRDALSTLSTLGAAREMLEKYGEIDAASLVRDVVLRRYIGSPNPRVAAVAAAAAGQTRYQSIDNLVSELLDVNSLENSSDAAAVTRSNFAESIETLIDAAPDLATVRYLGKTALRLESGGRGDYADTIYQIALRRFDDPDAATTAEVDMAVTAADRRRSRIGNDFAPAPSSILGPPIDLRNYRGRVVLMPFWVFDLPASTAIIDDLLDIADRYDNRVSVIGMNLDLTTDAAAKIPPADLPPIESLQGSAPSRSANPLAVQFGMVSYPFVMILDQTGQIAGFGYDPQTIATQVQRLLK